MPEDRPSPRLDGLLREAAARIGTVDAQWLLAHALGKPRSWLYAHADACVDVATAACFASLVERRHQGEPVAYLTGRRGFWKFELQVTADTLIPRPETELLVECALELLPRDAVSRIADLGTGTGAVALALAFERPRAQVLATDASERALDVARSNARALRLGNIGFAAGDWLAALGHARFDLIVSNPPYIAADDPHLGEGDLRFEPSSALASGRDGLDAIRRIVRDAGRHIEAGGWLLLEHGFDQGDAVRALLADAGFGQVRTERDLEQRERVSIGRNPADSPVI